MTQQAQSAPVTILYTDLVGSTALLQRTGDESAQRIFRAHHKVLQEAVAANGGDELKWLGDGLMVAFPSAADAVRCAIMMQESAKEPVAGERLEIRVGLNVGEALREEADYFGTPVVVARQLCDLAETGQILCTTLVSGFLFGRQAFTFHDLGELELKGVAEPVSTCEVLYGDGQSAVGPAPPPSGDAEAAEAAAAPVAILFTVLINSAELLEQAGDESAQHILQAHRKLLGEAVAANGGHEVKWMGDGLMVAFPSAANAVRCAVMMQQSARRPVAGERLDIRVGLNMGEALRDEADYFGTPVVVAKRLCDKAEGRQILCSRLVAGLLAGRLAFTFRDFGELELKGIPDPVATSEVVYEVDQPAALLSHPPFVGRKDELAKLDDVLQRAKAGQGGLLMLVGEPGIGKSRMVEEFTETARNQGVAVILGGCHEGEGAASYAPFAEAIEEYSRAADPEELRDDLANGLGPIARLVPGLRERLPDIPEPASLQPDEERFRLLDAVAQFLIAVSARAPLVLVLDDLHWAGKDTIAMLRHVARFVSSNRILLLGTYRDVELDRQHPLAAALGPLRQETTFERIVLKGLEAKDVGEFLATISEQDAPEALVATISSETNGNPFFMREVLLNLVEAGAYEGDGRWSSDAGRIEELGIPESLREAIGRRLSRLSTDANRLVAAASAFNGVFRFDLAASVASLEEMHALDAVDEALTAQLLRPGGEPETYYFTHALIRQTLYTEQSPSRQVRLHRRIAEGMEEIYGGAAMEHAADLAYQYHRSAAIPGAERGVVYALTAAERSEGAYAYDEAATFLRMALELLPEDDAQRPRLLGRVAQAVAWTLDYDEALTVASEAGESIAASEGADEAADYLAQAARTLFNAGFLRGAWDLAARGLAYAGDRRDATWAWLMQYDLSRREAEDPDNPGIVLDVPERREISRIAEQLPLDQRPRATSYYSSREDVLARGGDDDPGAVTYLAGEYHRGLALWQAQAERYEQQGQIANALSDWAQIARCHSALGDFAAAREAYDRGMSLSARLAGASPQGLQIFSARLDLRFAVDPESEETLTETEPLLQSPAAENHYALAAVQAIAALAYAGAGEPEKAVHALGTLVAPLERAPGWANNYALIACLCAAALWVLERTDHIEVIERNLREKVIAPDFRFPMQDGRLSLAQLSALQGRYDEAVDWFAQARTVLDEQGARPLRSITDLIEAEMYVRRGAAGDRERALPLLEAAVEQFDALGMPGWNRRAERLGLLTKRA